MAEKKVHGGVQFEVNFDDDHHPKVPCYAEAVDSQKHQGRGGLAVLGSLKNPGGRMWPQWLYFSWSETCFLMDRS